MYVKLNKIDLYNNRSIEKIAGDDDGDLATGATLFGAGAALNMGGLGDKFKDMHGKGFTGGGLKQGLKRTGRTAGKVYNATAGKLGKGMMGLGAIYGLRGLKRKLFDDD